MKRTPLRAKKPWKRKLPTTKVERASGKRLGGNKRTLKRVSKQPISKVQRVLWELCKQIVRLKYGNVCYTCGATGLSGSNWQTGHMWAKASLGAYLKYDIRVLRPQCGICNLFRGGMGADFYKKMLQVEGKEYMAQLEEDRKITVKAYDHYIEKIEEYRKILETLSTP